MKHKVVYIQTQYIKGLISSEEYVAKMLEVFSEANGVNFNLDTFIQTLSGERE